MPRRKPWIWYTAAALIVAGLSGCATTSTRMQTAAELDRVLGSPHRPETARALDASRHPKETLLFFGLRPEMTVVEIAPGNGWYTQILGPLLRDRGRLLAALPPVVEPNPNLAHQRASYQAMLDAAPGLLDRVQIVPFDPGHAPIAAAESADMVLALRELHDWLARDMAATAFREMFQALKPGGVLGVIGHRGNAQVPQDPRARSGYMNQDYAIQLIEGVGFRLVATSEINANPGDTKDHPNGVWSLPPALEEGDREREKYLAIGESDRFTLKFVRPR